MAQARYLDAARAWQGLLALRPDDADALQGLAAARTASQAGAREAAARARSAQSRGQVEAAMRGWVEVLAFAPYDDSAAVALRGLEAERARRALAPSPLARAPGVSLTRAERDAVPPTAPHAELEHATLLAAQGEVDAAIALLAPLARGGGADPALKSALANLYVRQAERLASAGQRQAALDALNRCLRLQPRHALALQLRARLRAPSAPASAASR